MLAVCKGLVLSRMLNIQHSVNLLTNRVSLHSYGVLYKEPFDSNRHDKKDCVKGLDGKSYVTNQVFKLIKKGEELSQLPKTMYPFFRMTDYKTPQDKWTDRIVLLTKGKDYTVLGDVETDLQSYSLKKGEDGVTRKFVLKWKRNPISFYKKISYKILPVILNDECIRIQTWFSNNVTGCGDFIASSTRITESKEVVDLPVIDN